MNQEVISETQLRNRLYTEWKDAIERLHQAERDFSAGFIDQREYDLTVSTCRETIQACQPR